MKLSDLINGMESDGDLVRIDQGDAPDSVRICDLTEDSRTAMPGSLFIARTGTKDQGARYIDQAVHAGAVVVVTDDPDAKAPEGFEPRIYLAKDAFRDRRKARGAVLWYIQAINSEDRRRDRNQRENHDRAPDAAAYQEGAHSTTHRAAGAGSSGRSSSMTGESAAARR